MTSGSISVFRCVRVVGLRPLLRRFGDLHSSMAALSGGSVTRCTARVDRVSRHADTLRGGGNRTSPVSRTARYRKICILHSTCYSTIHTLPPALTFSLRDRTYLICSVTILVCRRLCDIRRQQRLRYDLHYSRTFSMFTEAPPELPTGILQRIDATLCVTPVGMQVSR